MGNQRVYLAGPMSGIADMNRPAFNAEAERIRALGYHVENPAEFDTLSSTTWAGDMRIAIARMLTCDVVALLPNWDTSRGATIEVDLADKLQIPNLTASEITA